MNWLYKLQHKCRRLSVENLMLYITVTMLAVYLADTVLNLGLAGWLVFDRDHILSGQVWRLLTFIVLPPGSTAVFILFTLYFYYFIGTSLENEWGSSQFTFYYLCGVAGAIIAGFIGGTATNYYLNMSLFFAFAQLYPEHQVLLFFFLPVKIKYLAYIDWGLFALSFLWCLFTGDWGGCLSIAASLLNFFLFFGPDIRDKLRTWWHYRVNRRNFRKNTRNNSDFWR